MKFSDELQNLWFWGVLLAFIGTFCGALGDVLVRRSFQKTKDRKNKEGGNVASLSMSECETAVGDSTDKTAGCTDTHVQGNNGSLGGPSSSGEGHPREEASEKDKSLFLDHCWLTGMFMTAVVDPSLLTLSLLFAPSSIVTPFAGAHILWGCFLAVLLLGERMRSLDVLGAGMIVGGIVVIVIYASKAGSVQTLDDFLIGLKEPEAAICVAILLFFLSLSIVFACIPEKSLSARWWQQKDFPSGVQLCGIDLKRLGVCTAAGLLGGLTNTTTRILALELKRLYETPWVSVQDWRFYCSLVLTLTSALPQLYFLNTALKHFGAVFVVPTVNACIIVSGSVAAFCVLQELPRCLPACIGGVAAAVAGVGFLARPSTHAACCSGQGEKIAEIKSLSFVCTAGWPAAASAASASSGDTPNRDFSAQVTAVYRHRDDLHPPPQVSSPNLTKERNENSKLGYEV